MSERKANRDIYIHTFAFLLLFAYSTVTKTVLQFINCREVGPYKLVAAFPEVSCEAGAYKTWSAVYYTLLVVFVCFGPVGLLVLLIWARVKKRLYSERFSKRLVFPLSLFWCAARALSLSCPLLLREL